MKKFDFLALPLAFLLSVLMLVWAAFSVSTSPSFYLAQEDKYSLAEANGLKNANEFTEYSNEIIGAIKGKAQSEKLTEDETGAFNRQGKVLLFSALFCGLVSAALFIAFIKKLKQNGKTHEFASRFGWSLFFSLLVFTAGIFVLLHLISPSAFICREFSFVLFSENFFTDFLSGCSRFFCFIMLIPVFVSYLITRYKKKSQNINDDYLYQ